MKITIDKNENTITLKVSLKFRGKRGEIKYFRKSDLDDWIKRNHSELKIEKIIEQPAKPLNNVDRLNGTWVFGLQKEKPVDILKDNVKIQEIEKEAESPVQEQKNEASLPNGLKKITKTKRKRAPRKKKIEE